MQVNQDQVMRNAWAEFVRVMRFEGIDAEMLNFFKSVFIAGYVAGCSNTGESYNKLITTSLSAGARGLEQVNAEAQKHVIQTIQNELIMHNLRKH